MELGCVSSVSAIFFRLRFCRAYDAALFNYDSTAFNYKSDFYAVLSENQPLGFGLISLRYTECDKRFGKSFVFRF